MISRSRMPILPFMILLAAALGPRPGTAWAEDSGTGRIAFNSNRSGNDEIHVMDLAGGGVARLTTDPSDDRHPVWF